MIRAGSDQILSLVEDALAVGNDGEGHFALHPSSVSLRADVIERSWEAVRLQTRYAAKVRSIDMRLAVAENVPRRALLDATRAVQVLTNIVGNGAPAQRESTRGALLSSLATEDTLLVIPFLTLPLLASHSPPPPSSFSAVKFVPEGHGEVAMAVTYSEEECVLRIEVRIQALAARQLCCRWLLAQGRCVCRVSLSLLLGARVGGGEENHLTQDASFHFVPSSSLSVPQVRDNGRGLSAEGRARLFKPFQQAEGAGVCPAAPTRIVRRLLSPCELLLATVAEAASPTLHPRSDEKQVWWDRARPGARSRPSSLPRRMARTRKFLNAAAASPSSPLTRQCRPPAGDWP